MFVRTGGLQGRDRRLGRLSWVTQVSGTLSLVTPCERIWNPGAPRPGSRPGRAGQEQPPGEETAEQAGPISHEPAASVT